nr:hypothetical protein [Pseudomonas viridiflava]
MEYQGSEAISSSGARVPECAESCLPENLIGGCEVKKQIEHKLDQAFERGMKSGPDHISAICNPFDFQVQNRAKPLPPRGHNALGPTAGPRAAESEGCPRQIVQYSRLVYGFQCHMELTREVVELLIQASEADLMTLTDRRFVQQPPALRANDYDEMNQKLFVFLDKLVADYRAG